MTTTYPPAVQALLAEDRLPALGPGQPNLPMRTALASLTVEQICEPHPVVRLDMAQACLAGLWLHHDFLDESHKISQELDISEGSYWHAIMHRREGDFWNSKYWWKRVGHHPVLAELKTEATKLGWKAWDAAAFVDECERERDSGSEREALLLQVQRTEWRALFAWCFAQQR